MNQQDNTAPRWTRGRTQKVLGVMMIVKNEVENLPDLFESIREVADEVVVVDTGSTDGTLALCKRWGVTLIQDPWRNDFSRARNRAVLAAGARYLLWLDADDRLPAETQAELRQMADSVLRERNDRAYLFQVTNVGAEGSMGDAFLQTRLFPRRQGVRFVNPVHEQVTDSLKALGVELVRTELSVVHTGYASEEVVRAKGMRNLALLQQAQARDGGSVHHLIHMAQTLFGLGRYPEAEGFLSGAILRAPEQGVEPTLLAELHALRAGYRLVLANPLGATFDLEAAITHWPDWGLPYGVLAEMRLREKSWEAAAVMVELAREKPFTVGLVGFPLVRARSNVELVSGRLALQASDRDGAAARFRDAVERDPRNLEARLELGQLLLESEEYADAREVLEPAGEDPAAVAHFVDVSAAIGLARAMTGEMDGAAACLSPLLDLFSEHLGGAQDVSPIELAQALLKTGHGTAAKNMVVLFQKTMASAA